MQIRIAEYDAQWPLRFEREARRIRGALAGRALQVEHVGSTSVPGLAAKPIIDIVLVVTDSADEAAYAPALEAAGYRIRIREPEWFQHRMLKDGAGDVNLHVFSTGCPEVDRMIAFRNWLRAHPADRELYERTKRALAESEWGCTQDYADAKTAVVREILARTVD